MLCSDGAHIISLVAISMWMTGTDGDQTQKREGYMPGQIRQEELLATAVVIEGRKEWFCRFCSEASVWSSTKCRSCKTDIPAGLHAKHLQALSTKNGRWRTSCWRTTPNWSEKQSCKNCERKTAISKMKEGSGPCSSRSQMRKQGQMRTARWRWMTKKAGDAKEGARKGVAQD